MGFLCLLVAISEPSPGLWSPSALRPKADIENPPLLLRLPLPRQLLGLGYLGRRHLLGNNVAVLDRYIAVFAGGETRSSKVIPHMGLGVVLGDA